MPKVDLSFSSGDMAIVIFLCIFMSGAAGIIAGSWWSQSENRTKIEACQSKYKMVCELVPEAVQ